MSYNFLQVLNKRWEFEELTSSYSMPVKGSCINTLEWFVENGHRSNSLRNGLDNAMQLAKVILTEYEYVRGTETEDGRARCY